MTELTVRVPEQLKAFVDAEVAAGASASVSDFVCALIREAEKRRTRERVEAMLQEGLGSGEPIEVTPEYWNAKQRRTEDVCGSPQAILAAMRAEPHLKKEDVDELDRAIQAGKRPVSYRNPLAKHGPRKGK